ACPVGQPHDYFTSMTLDEIACEHPARRVRRRRKDAPQVIVELSRVGNRNRLRSAVVMLRDTVVHRLDWKIIRGWLRGLGRQLANLRHHPIDIRELLERRPSSVLTAPIQAWRQPDGEGFGEVLVGMLLRVPTENVPHVRARKRIRAVAFTVRLRKSAEGASPVSAFVKV